MLVCVACYGDRVAALLETATELRFYAQGTGQEARRAEQRGAVRLPVPVQQLGLGGLLDRFKGAEASVLLCGGLTCCALESLRNAGVHVAPWVSGDPGEVAQAWWMDRIETVRMPGCLNCGQGRRWRGNRTNKQAKGKRSMNTGIIAVTSEGPKLTDMVDPRFGRAAGFVVVDLETGAASYLDNGGSQAMAQGAGIQAAENVAKAGAGVVLSGFVGPKAFQALSAAGIKVVQNVENMTVGQAVDKFKVGELAVAQAPNAPAGGHKG